MVFQYIRYREKTSWSRISQTPEKVVAMEVGYKGYTKDGAEQVNSPLRPAMLTLDHGPHG